MDVCKEDRYREYKDVVCLFCRQCAIVERYKEMVLQKKEPNLETFKYHLELMAYAKKELLRMKEELGMTDGLKFMQDSNFFGFSLKNGCVSGDLTHLPDIVIPWVQQEDSHFKYEVGVLLLSHYFMQRDEYKFAHDCLEKKESLRSRIKRMMRGVMEKTKRLFLLLNEALEDIGEKEDLEYYE